jgi:hypothetical protein
VDARKLADLLRTGMLRPVYHGENGLRTLRELGRSYQTISKDLTRVMNRLKARYRFENDTKQVRTFLKSITLESCFKPAMWEEYRFFALVKPDNDIFPVRTVYEGATHNIGNNYLKSDTPIWFAGPDLVASILQTGGKVPDILKAVRMVARGDQDGMESVSLRVAWFRSNLTKMIFSGN